MTGFVPESPNFFILQFGFDCQNAWGLFPGTSKRQKPARLALLETHSTLFWKNPRGDF